MCSHTERFRPRLDGLIYKLSQGGRVLGAAAVPPGAVPWPPLMHRAGCWQGASPQGSCSPTRSAIETESRGLHV